MEFTGERVVPGKVEPDLFNEHVSRYYFARPLVERKSVLDLGCGSGYGASILASSARYVLGTDISWEAVSFAKQHYATPNLQFFASDCSNLSLRSESLDTVVCFEVIEHLTEQCALLEQADRVLKRDGFLVISTPNRVFYTDERREVNPFHTREFNFEEFRSCLKHYFAKVEVYFQNHVSSIFVGDFRLCEWNFAAFGDSCEEMDKTSNFFVAICAKTDHGWPFVKNLVYVPSTANLLREKELRIQHLERRIVELDESILRLQRDYDERTGWSLELDRELGKRDQTILSLRRELEEVIKEKDSRILTLQGEFDERTEWALRLDFELKACQQALQNRQEQLDRVKESNLFRLARTLRLVPRIG